MSKIVKLGDVCDLQNGFAFKSKLFKDIEMNLFIPNRIHYTFTTYGDHFIILSTLFVIHLVQDN